MSAFRIPRGAVVDREEKRHLRSLLARCPDAAMRKAIRDDIEDALEWDAMRRRIEGRARP